jgi:membrane protease YdiL (CAAX protease family)
MFRNLTDRAKAAVFSALVLAMTLALVVPSPMFGELTPLITMFTPLLAVLFMLMVVTRDGYTRAGWFVLGLHRAGLRGWGPALLLPLLTLGFGYAVVWLIGIATLVLPTGAPPLLVVGLSIVLTLLLAFGEEIGWRGYLLPHLVTIGRGRALLLSGLLHGIWHLPILLLTPYYHNLGDRLVVTALFLATLTAAGVVYGYLRLMTGSVWPAVIAHGAANTYRTTLGVLFVGTSPVTLEYLAGESGVLPLIATAVIAGWLLYRLGQEPRAAQHGIAPYVEAKA